MSKSNTFENDMMLLFFNATTINDLAENDTTSPATDLHVGLKTADPGEASDQSTSEATYTGYARKAVVRTSSGWTVTGNAVENTAAITFAQCTGGSDTITHFDVGTKLTTAGKTMYKGALGASLAVSNGITPEFPAGGLDISED